VFISGLSVGDHLGNFNMKNATDVEFGLIDSEKTLAVQIKHDGKLEDTNVHFQCALVYTTFDGYRRIRVHNLVLNASTQIVEIFRCADLDTTVNYLARGCKVKILL
jgi:protein transport protein SEC24